MQSKKSPGGRIHRHKLNKLGRDFVVGDIHGAYEMLAQGMRKVRFNPRLDRLFSVGDLIDRGPDSLRALEYLAKPWFYAIRGNHDDDFEKIPSERLRHLALANWNGLGWAAGLPERDIDRLKERFASLPVAMEVQTKRGVVGLVHGEVPQGMGWSEFLAKIDSGDEACIESALWGRERIQSADASGVAGIDRLFVGHTIQWTGPKRLGNVYAIDTGAVFHELGADMGSMTMVNLMCCSQAIVAPPQPGSLREPVWTIEQPAHGAFGSYVFGKPTTKP
jgi:serine/threonine protein phosphatase 1